MDRQPDDTTIAAWIGLSRAQRVATASIEAQLKAAGFPPLAWYDALWELERAGGEGLRPFELERVLLFEQYNLSRLIDRLEKAGLVVRRACPNDKRGQVLAITPEGLTLRRDMWGVYGPAIEAAVGAKLDAGEAKALAGLLAKLAITSA
ncbi:helix-turn-helix domain-containing protein [Mesorhizobium sp. YR577]|uniref:MarR family winged helix-turn-helix transcriptional regulator n=1 Tax=Mesorhizobium sp. YR577 TaxID=1884373 RepID=UPI0008EA8F1B|nr:helix-turn-helix domain-containing protein [Mesorhizobium sp. YR577]SFT85748.1 DNA-binding transcriptional regulator, MarR family [Mesorhizobium sp. YR577]